MSVLFILIWIMYTYFLPYLCPPLASETKRCHAIFLYSLKFLCLK